MSAETKAPRIAEELDRVWDVVVVGGGPAGSTAALYTARAGWSTAVLDKGIAAGALAMASEIANYPGVGEPLTGSELLQRIRAQAMGFGASFVDRRITAATLSETGKTLFASAGSFRGRAVIIATGSMGRARSIPGEERLAGRGVSYCTTCDGFFFRDQDVAVIGNNDEALEEALHVARFARRVVIVCPTARLRAHHALAQQAEANERIEIRFSTPVREIVGETAVQAVAVGSGESEETIPVAGVFIYLQGGKPILDYLGGQLDVTDDGCLRVDGAFQTSVPGVFAAGDVLCKHIKQAVIAAAEGAQAALAVDRYLSGRPSLKPDWA